MRHSGRRPFRACFALLVVTASLWSQRYQITYTPNSQEGLLLQLIEQLEGDAKIQQMDEFLKRYPNHPSVMWIYEYQQIHYTKTGQIDKALAAGDKMFSLQPDDLETAVTNQKLAEKKNDPDQVRRWSEAAAKAAQKLIGAPKPFYVSQEEWNKRIEYAGGLLESAEYTLYKKAMDAEKASEKIKLLEELLAKSPTSLYAIQSLPHLMTAYRSVGSLDRALATGEKILAKDPDQEDALLTVAQIHLDRRTNYARVLAIANRLLNLRQPSKKPENYSEEDWNRRRSFYSGAAYQLMGTAHVFQNNFEQADQAFRAALPFIKGNTIGEAAAYFYLGWSNYYMEKYKEAGNWFKQCLAIQSPFQSQAARHLDGLRRERRIFE